MSERIMMRLPLSFQLGDTVTLTTFGVTRQYVIKHREVVRDPSDRREPAAECLLVERVAKA